MKQMDQENNRLCMDITLNLIKAIDIIVDKMGCKRMTDMHIINGLCGAIIRFMESYEDVEMRKQAIEAVYNMLKINLLEDDV